MLATLAAILIGTSAGDSTPARPITQLVHTRWTTKDGAPAEIRTLAQTSDGYLWLGTGAGLFRFDGVRFVQFTPRGGDSLPDIGVSRLMTTRDGSLWIVWPNGMVSRLRDGRITSYGEREGLPPTFQLAESSRGVMVAGTSKGIARLTDGKWEDVGPAWGFPPSLQGHGVWFDRNDVLWAEANEEIIYLPAGAQRFVITRMIIRDRVSATNFAQETDGTIWMNELARSAHTLRLPSDTTFASEVRVRATTVLVDRKGGLWVGSAGDGLRRVIDPMRIRGRAILKASPEAEQFTMKDGLLSDIITALLEDREGNIWVASNEGLERFRHGAFTPIAPLGPARSRFVFAARDTSLWTAAQDMTGILRLAARDTATIPTDFVVTNLAQDSAGSIYSARNHRILKFQGSGFAPLHLQKVRAVDLVDITVDSKGTLWVFDGIDGLLRLDHDRLTQAAALYEPVARRGVLFSDRKGRIWIGQLNRVAMYDHGQLSIYDAKQGVPQGLVFQVLEDHAGNIWAVGDGGMSKFENGRFRTIAEGRGIPGGKVYGIAEDEGGAWWMVTRAGVLRLPPGEIDRALADSTHRIRYRAFDRQDGLPGAVTVSEWGSPVVRTADGRIWVATDSGVASVNPRNLPPDLPLPVLIESVRIDGREVSPSDAGPIPAGRRDLEIDYTATSLASPERAQFRYRLEGEDSTWHDVGTQRRVNYNRLGPGDYRFRVAARNGDGVWDEKGSVWTFRVLPPWYQTLWFAGGVVILIGALGAGSTSIVQRRRHVRAQDTLKSQYEATLAERGRIAQELHDTLLQGFVGVTLQLKAAENALPGKPEDAVETIRRVQRLARESLREARERVWDMRQTEVASLDLPAALESVARERASGTGIEVSVVIVGERRRLERRLEDAAFRIGREAVANAIRHAEARRIDIVVKYGASTFSVEVRDDGRGFSPEEAEEARRQGHFGLSGVRERAMSMGGHCDVHARAEGGTVVALELPLA